MLATALLALAAGAAAPGRPAADTAPRPGACDSAVARSRVGSAVDTLVLALRSADGGAARLPSPWAELAADAVAERLVLPRPVALPVFERVGRASRRTGGRPDTVAASVTNAVLVLLGADGRVQGAPLLAATALDDATDAAVLRAVRAADGAGALPAPPEGAAAPLRVLVGLGVREGEAGADAAGAGEAERTVDHAATVAVPVALVRRDRVLAGEMPRPQPAHGDLAYPAEERARHRTGRVSVDYVLGADGAPVPGTAVAVRYTSPAFARAVLEYLPLTRTTPARVAGCAVPLLVRQPVEFRMGASPGGG